MAEVHLTFDGARRGSCAAYGFVVRAGGLRVGRGWGAGNTGLSRLRAALLALERGLEFVVDSPLAQRSVMVGSDAPQAISAVLRPGSAARRPAVSTNLTDLISQFEALRFDRAHTRANQEASALAQLGLAQFELFRRPFFVCDDAGFSEYLKGAAERTAPTGDPEPFRPGIPDFFALPFDAEQLGEVLDRMPFREREIIKLRLAPYSCTFSQIGVVFRICGQRVRQILDRALMRLWWLAVRVPAWR